MSTDLAAADLTATELTLANFVGADLSGANLTGASLTMTRFQLTNLTGATFSGATLNRVLFANTKLSKAIGLDSCTHDAPNTIGTDTLFRSGHLPLTFLRGCGLPNRLIEFLPSLVEQPIQFYSCFISYSTKDQEFADRLYADLQDAGVRCWFAPKDLKVGERFRDRIDEAIRFHEKLLVVLSQHSIDSNWVREEVEACCEREHREKRDVLFPVRLDDTVMTTNQAWASSIRRQRHIGDFEQWKVHDSYKKAFDRLLRDLHARGMNRQEPAPG